MGQVCNYVGQLAVSAQFRADVTLSSNAPVGHFGSHDCVQSHSPTHISEPEPDQRARARSANAVRKLKMPIRCAVAGCSYTLATFRIPCVIENQGSATKELSERRRREWIRQIGRKGITFCTATYQRGCHRHFISGKSCFCFSRRRSCDIIISLTV